MQVGPNVLNVLNAHDHVLVPVTSVTRSISRHDQSAQIPHHSRVIRRGPASRSSVSSASPWRPFMHPEGQLYFVLNGEFNFSVVTESNVHDTGTARRILDYLELVKKELEDKKICVPPRCELFLQLARDSLSCNYYFVDHTGTALFWLEDVNAESLGISLATSSFHIELSLERLYWMHVEFYPMHYESDEIPHLVNDLCGILDNALADRLTSMSSASTYSADTCKQFLRLLSRKRGQPMDGRIICSAARLAGDIATWEFFMLNSQHCARSDELQQILLPGSILKEGSCLSYRVSMGHFTVESPNASESRKAWSSYNVPSQDLNSAEERGSVKLDDAHEPSSTMRTLDGVTEAGVSLEEIRLNFPHDLTGYVTRSGTSPFASGGCGDIYRGKLDMRTKSIDVAIKVHRVYLQHNIELHERIKGCRREIIASLQLNHPNILPLLGTVRDPKLHSDILPAMVTPWIENGALTSYLERNENLSTEQRLLLVDGVAQGLQYLHSHHVVHGDLSGSNVLVRGDGTACICDFGLSTLLTLTERPTFVTSRNKGTVRWMAPELLDLHMITNPTLRSDVYSFGSIMLQILTGNIPYHRLRRDAQVILAISQGARPDRSNEETVTVTRWKFIEKCWSMNPDLRPSSEEIIKFTSQELSDVWQTKGGRLS